MFIKIWNSFPPKYIVIGAPHLLGTSEYVLDNVWEDMYKIREKSYVI